MFVVGQAEPWISPGDQAQRVAADKFFEYHGHPSMARVQ
jgi:hypothetical protein